MWLFFACVCAPRAAAAAPEAPAPAPSLPAPSPAAPSPPAPLRITDDAGAPGGWSVRDAAGHLLTTVELAEALGDTDVLARIRGGRRLTWAEDGVLVALAAGLGVGGVLELATAGPAVSVGARPDPDAYGDYGAWRVDAGAWEERLARSDTHDEHVWTGITLLSGAALGVALVPLTGQDARARARHPALRYDRATLEERLRLLAPVPAVGPASVQLTWMLP